MTATPACPQTCSTLHELQRHLDRIELVVDGDDSRDVRGLRQRVTTLESVVEEMIAERAAVKQRMTGLIVGVTVASVGSGGTLILTLLKLWMGMQ